LLFEKASRLTPHHIESLQGAQSRIAEREAKVKDISLVENVYLLGVRHAKAGRDLEPLRKRLHGLVFLRQNQQAENIALQEPIERDRHKVSIPTNIQIPFPI
jgi:hypothetical protein